MSHMYLNPSPKWDQPLWYPGEQLPQRPILNAWMQHAMAHPHSHIVIAKWANDRFSPTCDERRSRKAHSSLADCIHMVKLNLWVVLTWIGPLDFLSGHNELGWIRFWNETYRRTESVSPVPAHFEVEEERRLKVGSAGDVLVLAGVDFTDTRHNCFFNSAFRLWAAVPP